MLEIKNLKASINNKQILSHFFIENEIANTKISRDKAKEKYLFCTGNLMHDYTYIYSDKNCFSIFLDLDMKSQ